MKKVDVFNHIFPPRYWDKMIEIAGDLPDMGKRVRSVPMLMDLDERWRVMDQFEDYYQILSIANPPLERIAGPQDSPELAQVGNDGMAELCDRYPERFAGFTASLPMNNPDAAVRETQRAVRDLGAGGVQMFTDVNGEALDDPKYFPILAAAHELDAPIWVHPCRGADRPDYPNEERSKYEIWWTLGWPYETSVMQARLVFSGIMDRLPRLKIITHHMGGMMPYFAGRTGPGWMFLGDRTSGPEGEEYRRIRENLAKPHAEYFKDFYADTALFGAGEATELGLKYYPRDKVLFASDAPFDPEKGPMYIRETIRIIDNLDIDDDWREDIYWRNTARIMSIRGKAAD